MSRIVIEHALLFDGDAIIAPATIAIEGATVAEITAGAGGPQQPGEQRIDAAGRLVTPGLVNAHTHIYSTFARGIALKDPAPTNFAEILENLWWRLDRSLTLEDITLSARWHAAECLHAGVTTIFDHHASQTTIAGSLAAIASAVTDLGLRACLCFEVSDRAGAEAATAGIAENARFARSIAGTGAGTLQARFGLHASLTLSDETLAACAAAATTGFHVHVAEDRIDQENARDRGAESAVARLAGAGILGEQTLCVHGVHLSDEEVNRLAATGTWLIHCPESNMNNAVGGAVLERFRRRGVRMALGTDGFTADVVRETLVAHLLQNHLTGQPGAGYQSVPALPFEANAALAREAFGLPLGNLQVGAPADVVVWDYLPPTPLTRENLYGHLLFGLTSARAHDVVVSGRMRLSQGHLTDADEDRLAAECTAAAARLWERF